MLSAAEETKVGIYCACETNSTNLLYTTLTDAHLSTAPVGHDTQYCC